VRVWFGSENELTNKKASLARRIGRSLSQYEQRTNEAGFVRIGLSYQRREVANALTSALPSPLGF